MWGTDNNYSLSLRLSCERCRIQKLKCSMPTGAIVCERCTRAKVPCVFSRRTPSRRALNNAKAKRFDSAPEIYPAAARGPRTSRAPVSPTSPTPERASGITVAAQGTSGSMDLQPLTPITEGVPTSSAPEFEPVAFTAEAGGNDVGLGLQDMMVGCDSSTIACSWLQSELSPKHANTYDATAGLDTMSWSQLALLATAAGGKVVENAAAFGDGEGGASIESRNNTALVNQQITALISEVQHLLQTLEASPWQTNSADSLDDYPVGTILKLSQQFGSIAGNAGISEGGTGTDGSPSDKTDSSVESDMLTMLLVMCGYMLLAHLYEVVLDHFQNHLSHMPLSNDLGRVMAGTPGTITPTGLGGDVVGLPLSLGELSCTNATLSLQKIHMAVGMLLNALHEVKDRLGFEVATARDMAVNLLLNSRRRNDGRLSDLGEKATAIKELIRERMGF